MAGIVKPLGGQRLGSGNKMNVHMHGYGRSSHNLSRAWRSSMAPGTLVPFIIEPILNGDTFDIDLSTLVRTLPTNGPIFGSFKMQLDVFMCPIRLYNAQLHNNKLGIGMEMDKVMFPMMELTGPVPQLGIGQLNQQQINSSSLLAYLGTRGLGKPAVESNNVTRQINAMPLLMYWDIYKNYYANKQENIGAVIDWQQAEVAATVYRMVPSYGNRYDLPTTIPFEISTSGVTVKFYGTNLTMDSVKFQVSYGTGNPYAVKTPQQIYDEVGQGGPTGNRWARIEFGTDATGDYIEFTSPTAPSGKYLAFNNLYGTAGSTEQQTPIAQAANESTLGSTLDIATFDLSNIDLMREQILQAPVTSPFLINVPTGEAALGEITMPMGGFLPYSSTTMAITEDDGRLIMNAYNEMAGLGLKTYQSDRFNNWLSTEWIDGANGISAITAVDTSSGSFTMDALNLAQKVYDMLNRIAVSGGSYNDWQEAVYGEKSARMAESPIYMGGMSTEIVFNEVVSTADSTATSGEDQPLGTLAGRGKDANHKGGTIRVKANEPAYVMGIVSLTPRIDYSQGNKWWTRLETMNDLHKPALDGIGFQELLTDEMAAWDTVVANDGTPTYKSAGKQPAWIHYMTATNECYGHFANLNEEMFMTLNRRYEPDETGNIKDLTTYIDPTKYNYAFAVQELKAQNFWIQIGIDMIARRKMSAKIIPNL